jgi:glycosyltransferase involved in cell wall biosynthesis
MNHKNFEVVEHGRDFKPINIKLYEYPSKNTSIKILFIGNLNNHKGSNLIQDIKKQDKNSRLEFHFLGKISPSLKKCGIYHGAYERDHLNDKIEKIKPSFVGIFSIWPETYCHTLSEAWNAQIPVLSTKIGVLEERMIKNNGGWFIDIKDPKKSYKTILNIADNLEDYKKVQSGLKEIKFKNTTEMANEYLKLYQLLI